MWLYWFFFCEHVLLIYRSVSLVLIWDPTFLAWNRLRSVRKGTSISPRGRGLLALFCWYYQQSWMTFCEKREPQLCLQLPCLHTFLLSQPNRRSGSLGLTKVTLFDGLVYVVTCTVYMYVLCVKSRFLCIEWVRLLGPVCLTNAAVVKNWLCRHV